MEHTLFKNNYIDVNSEKLYNTSNKTYSNKEVFIMTSEILADFLLRLDDFYKYAPKEVLDNFRSEFMPKFKTYIMNKNDNELFNLLDEWFDTIDIYSNPETIDELETALKEIKNGAVFEWTPGTFTK